jgi:hypothetical protein
MGGSESEERIHAEDRLVLWLSVVRGLEKIRGGVGVKLKRKGMLDWLVLGKILLLEVDWIVKGVSDNLTSNRSIEIVCQGLDNV